jgi:hypothetical protein
MQFSRIICPVKDLEVWSASSRGFSFAISFESRAGLGLRGKPGFVASWRPLYPNRSAIKVCGSPFEAFAEAEKPASPSGALDAMTKNGSSAPFALGPPGLGIRLRIR